MHLPENLNANETVSKITVPADPANSDSTERDWGAVILGRADLVRPRRLSALSMHPPELLTECLEL